MNSTPVVTFEHGGQTFYAKDERRRLELNSFKSLGAFYATYKLFEENGENPVTQVITASAGNHGIGVAYAANTLKLVCTIWVPATCPPRKVRLMRSLGACVHVTEFTYEQVCDYVEKLRVPGPFIKVLDFDSDYSPNSVKYVREGYKAIVHELSEYFSKLNIWPDCVFLQGGVGTFSAAITEGIRANWPEQPNIIIVEPSIANCLQKGVLAGDTDDALSNSTSIMQSIDCKTASPSALKILQHNNVSFVDIDDASAIRARNLLSLHELKTSPTGAAGFAGANKLNAPWHKRNLIFITETSEEYL